MGFFAQKLQEESKKKNAHTHTEKKQKKANVTKITLDNVVNDMSFYCSSVSSVVKASQ
jgi:hypothetical protein